MAAPLVVTSGEPAGIGPDLCLQLAGLGHPVVVVADRDLLQQRATLLGQQVELHEYTAAQPLVAGKLSVLHLPTARPVCAGQLDAANAPYVMEMLRIAVHGCLSGEFAGMVTAPVHKGVINEAGMPFTGHTEFLAELSHTPHVVMMLAGGGMRVALTTTHLPLRDVADAITPSLLEAVIRILHRDLQQRFNLPAPRILIAGLNPHAGEGGHMGHEEIEVMLPVIDKLRAVGFDLSPPLPADTLFAQHRLQTCDAVLAMYHDQGLPVLKHASFGGGVNITLGLPFIRTSVDHGTALELAASGQAHVGSLLEALKVAQQMRAA